MPQSASGSIPLAVPMPAEVIIPQHTKNGKKKAERLLDYIGKVMGTPTRYIAGENKRDDKKLVANWLFLDK